MACSWMGQQIVIGLQRALICRINGHRLGGFDGDLAYEYAGARISLAVCAPRRIMPGHPWGQNVQSSWKGLDNSEMEASLQLEA
jgi:hypothetical protein